MFDRDLLGARADERELFARRQAVGGADRQAGLVAPLEARDPHHVELVEIRGEDREELGTLEQRQRLVLGECEHPRVEVEPAQFAVEVAILGQTGERGVAFDGRCRRWCGGNACRDDRLGVATGILAAVGARLGCLRNGYLRLGFAHAPIIPYIGRDVIRLGDMETGAFDPRRHRYARRTESAARYLRSSQPTSARTARVCAPMPRTTASLRSLAVSASSRRPGQSPPRATAPLSR